MTEAWYNCGICERRVRKFDDAIASMRRAIQCAPKYVPAYESLASLLYRYEMHSEAAATYRAWWEFDSDLPVVLHMYAATNGELTPARAEDGYVAIHFDSSVAALGNRAPPLLVGALAEHIAMHSRNYALLDAGRGTGLCGIFVRSSARRLTGVDLSTGMIGKARQRQVYDELVVQELVAHMQLQAQYYEFVLSADTLCYFGDLMPSLAAMSVCMLPQGVIAFTLEAAGETHAQSPFVFNPSGRYAHALSYLETSLIALGFQPLTLDRVVLRKERGVDVIGHLYVARHSQPASAL
jgi:predicted TPR repeat methyltransferase